MRALGRQIRGAGSKLPFVLIPVTMVISSLTAGQVTGSTFALSYDAVHASGIEFQALTTSQVLRFASGRVQLLDDAGPDRVGSEVVRIFRVMNISDRRVSLSVELTGIPWARAELSRSVLGPGETAEIIVSGTPDAPGEYRGYLTVYGMGRFLELSMEFTVVVLPMPDPCRPDEWPRPRAGGGEVPGDPIGVPEPEAPEPIIGLHPDLLGLPADSFEEPADAVSQAPAPAETQPDGGAEDPEAAGGEGEGAGEPSGGEVGEASEAGHHEEGADPVAPAPSGTTDPCADPPVTGLPEPAPDCGPPAQAVMTEEDGDQPEESGDCSPGAAPPDDQTARPGDGPVDGRPEEQEDPAEDSADGGGDSPQDGSPEDEAGVQPGDDDEGGEPDGDPAEGDGNESDGDPVEDDGSASDGVPADVEGDGSDGEPVGDDGSESDDAPADDEGDGTDEGADDGGPVGDDADRGAVDTGEPVEAAPGDTGGGSGESGDGETESADPPAAGAEGVSADGQPPEDGDDGAAPEPIAQPEAGADAPEDPDAGGQDT